MICQWSVNKTFSVGNSETIGTRPRAHPGLAALPSVGKKVLLSFHDRVVLEHFMNPPWSRSVSLL